MPESRFIIIWDINSLEESWMRVVQLFQHLLHDSFPEENCLRTDTKLVAILSDCSHLTIIQIDNLSMTTHKSRLLLLKIFRVDADFCRPFCGHVSKVAVS